jgi:hypothetical protein
MMMLVMSMTVYETIRTTTTEIFHNRIADVFRFPDSTHKKAIKKIRIRNKKKTNVTVAVPTFGKKNEC